MRGHIEKRKTSTGSTSYRLTVSTGEQLESGKYRRIRETISGSRAQAERRLREIIHEVETGSYRSRRDPHKLTELVEDWITTTETNSRISGSPRQTTVDMYRWFSNRYVIPLIGEINLQRLRPSDIQRFHEELSHLKSKKGEALSSHTLAKVHTVLSMALRHGQKLGFISTNPAGVVGMIAQKRTEIEVITPSDAAKVFEKLNENSPVAVVASKLALATGARRSEVCALNWKDVDFETNTIFISKAFIESKQGPTLVDTKSTKSRRRAAVAQPGIEALRKWRLESENIYRILGVPLSENKPVFINAEGGRLHPQSLSRAWRRACKRVGIKIKFHALRHSFATTALEAGVPLAFVSNQLGHSSVAITADTYGHVAEGFGQQAAEAVSSRFAEALSGGNKGITNRT